MPDRTIVCRCEDLTLQDIRDIIAAGLTTMEEVKRLTRCGMGPCQGRTCGAIVAAEIARTTGVPIEDVALPTFRPPIKPVKFALFSRTAAPGDRAGAWGLAPVAGAPNGDPTVAPGPTPGDSGGHA